MKIVGAATTHQLPTPAGMHVHLGHLLHHSRRFLEITLTAAPLGTDGICSPALGSVGTSSRPSVRDGRAATAASSIELHAGPSDAAAELGAVGPIISRDHAISAYHDRIEEGSALRVAAEAS